MTIKLHTHEEQTSIRRQSMTDDIFAMCYTTLRQMEGKQTTLSAIDIWVAAGQFGKILLSLALPSEEVAIEAEDLQTDCQSMKLTETDAAIIMAVTANRIAPYRKQRPEVGQIIQLLSPFYVNQDFYHFLRSSVGQKERLLGRKVDLLTYELRNCTDADAEREQRKIMQQWADSMFNTSVESLSHNMLVFCRVNMDNGHKYDDILTTLFDKLGIKSATSLSVTAADGGKVTAVEVNGNGKVIL